MKTSGSNIDLTGKRALVTGGSRGIGAAIARCLAVAGADVAINYFRARDAAEAVAASIRESGRQALVLQGDVADSKQVADMFGELAREWGSLDILINNSGWEDSQHAIDMPESSFNRAIGTNLGGIFHCSQQAARLMIKSGGGAIVNNLSIHDEAPRKGAAHYCSSKAGAKMLTKCLALEWAEYNIRVNGISPGAIETDMNREGIEALGRENVARSIPANRIGSVEEMAEIVLFLISDHAAYVTGSTLYADGGYRLTTVPYDDRPPRAD